MLTRLSSSYACRSALRALRNKQYLGQFPVRNFSIVDNEADMLRSELESDLDDSEEEF